MLLDNGAAVIGLVIAFVGIFLEHVFQLAYLDGIASILIGLTLAAVAVVLAVESKGLLIGEGVDKQTLEHIRRLAESDSAVVRAGGPLTMYFGPHTILLALDVQFHQGLSASEVTSAVDRLEKTSGRSTRRFKGSLSKRNRLLQARTFRLHFRHRNSHSEGCGIRGRYSALESRTTTGLCYWQIQMF